ncbi:hypothetical protein GCM10009624_27040 [Gordonia sinesedis]
MRPTVTYHINPKTGEPNVCHATVRGCPLGIVAAAHVESAQECRSMYERVMADHVLPRRATRANARQAWRLPPHLDRLVYDEKIPAMHAYFAATA